MHRYEIILYWRNEDQAVIAEAPELPGCMAHGDNREEALKNIQDVMPFWIDTACELGRPVPQPKGERLVYA
ncbi:MAG: type II toxin-antitoxin system HicB family antitoxin [Gammaproteobacteria bacterium]|nr:type II toxin-antitoxin system HicB family antitoxin [Gammaproteobacteria bacterium]